MRNINIADISGTNTDTPPVFISHISYEIVSDRNMGTQIPRIGRYKRNVRFKASVRKCTDQ